MTKWLENLPLLRIEDATIFHGIEKKLVIAIMQAESAGDNYAIRYEPKFFYRQTPEVFAEKNNITIGTEVMLQSCSIGLMQIMGCVARELGLKNNLLTLTVPRIGIKYGCLKLKQLIDKYDDLDRVIASYNAGSPVYKNNEFVNQGYVNKIKTLMGQL